MVRASDELDSLAPISRIKTLSGSASQSLRCATAAVTPGAGQGRPDFLGS
jgi:hypothetical protein